jgi:hypothetical protein
MGHGLRIGSQCVGANTKVLIERNGSPKWEAIKQIRCIFKEAPNGKTHTYHQENTFENADRVVNLLDATNTKSKTDADGLSLPLFIYEYTYKGASETFYTIIAKPKRQTWTGGEVRLVTTELHPIMKTQDRVTVASLLDKGDNILLRVGAAIEQGVVIEVLEETRPATLQVYGLALGKVWPDESPEESQKRLEKIKELLDAGEAYWNDFGLSVAENVIFTVEAEKSKNDDEAVSIASGTLALQHQVNTVIKQGISFNLIQQAEANMLAHDHDHEPLPVPTTSAEQSWDATPLEAS